MKKTFLMTLIALSISGMSCAQSDTENTAKKQEKVQQEFVKERRAQAKMGSYNIVVFLTICISYANNCFTL